MKRTTLQYVGRAMDQFDTALFAGIQKSNYLDVHERYALHIKPNRGPLTPVCFLNSSRCSDRTRPKNQPDHGSAPIRVPFDFQSHFVSLITCNGKLPAISN